MCSFIVSPYQRKKADYTHLKKKNYILIRLVFFLNFLFAPYVKKKTPRRNLTPFTCTREENTNERAYT